MDMFGTDVMSITLGRYLLTLILRLLALFSFRFTLYGSPRSHLDSISLLYRVISGLLDLDSVPTGYNMFH